MTQRMSVNRTVLGLLSVVSGFALMGAAFVWVYSASYRWHRVLWLLEHPADLLRGVGLTTGLILAVPFAFVLVGLVLVLTAGERSA